MKTTVQQVSNLHQILSDKSLKSKHLTTDNFFSLVGFKKQLKSVIDDAAVVERGLAEQYKPAIIKVNGRDAYKTDDADFFVRLDEIKKREVELTGGNFITNREEFKKFVEDMDVEQSMILMEFIFKNP